MKARKTMYNEKYQAEQTEIPDFRGNTVSITIDEITKEFNKTDWRTFEIIVSKGISEEKDAKRIVVDTMIDEDFKCVSEDTVWRSIKALVLAHVFQVKKINTGVRIFNLLILTEIGRIIYMKKYRKNPPIFEHERILRDHGSYLHGYMIKDLKGILEKMGRYDTVTIGRSENFIHLGDGRSCIPDVIATKGSHRDYFEVECGNHNQRDFDEKCNKLKVITRNIVIVIQNRDRATKALKPQVESWIRSVGRSVLQMTGTRVYLTSISDLKAGKWSYIYDMTSDEPICCFKKQEEGGRR